MSRTAYHNESNQSNTGWTVYAKPLPLTNSAWGDDVAAFTETGALASYSGTVTDTAQVVFRNIDGTPGNEASTDTRLGIIDDSATLANQTTLLSRTASSVILSQPVATSGQITGVIVIGDDYLAANSRAFEWTVSAVTGVTVGTATCTFGIGGQIFDGSVTDNGDETWTLGFDLSKTDTALLSVGGHPWSVELKDADGTEITSIQSSQIAAVTSKHT